jgi:hypothetical protein
MTHFMPSSRTLHVLDAALALWAAAWIALGVLIGINVRNLTELSNTVSEDGQAVATVGASLHSLEGVPLIGGQIGTDAAKVQRAGEATASSGRSTVSSIRALSVLLGIAVALLPTVPVMLLYLPARLARRREAAALRRALAVHADDRDFLTFLARRATDAVGYHELRRVSRTPWADVENGDCEALAQTELRRLGIDPRLLRARQRSSR